MTTKPKNARDMTAAEFRQAKMKLVYEELSKAAKASEERSLSQADSASASPCDDSNLKVPTTA